MAGKHSAGRPAWQLIAERRFSAASPGHVVVPGPTTVDLTDGHTLVTHSLTDGLLTLGRPVGRYRAICGARLLATSQAKPERGRCPTCARWTS
ncbi:MAG: hypothetical protein ACRDS9_17430 [Pseudonocardiaceae bacterium]